MTTIILETEDQRDRYTAVLLKHGIKLYARSGLIPNRNWTITKMMARAAQITGKQFKKRDYAAAVDALEEFLK